MKTTLLISAAGVAIVAMAPATRRVQREISPEALRAHVEAFAHDSMRGRATGTEGLERATRYLVAQLEHNAIAPAGNGGTYYQAVPLRWKRTDIDGAQMFSLAGSAKPLSLRARVEFVPLVDMFGTDSPDSASIALASRVRAPDDSVTVAQSGLGGSAPRYMLIDPPRRANGQPDYQMDFTSPSALENGKLSAVFLPTLDLMPRGFLEQLDRPRLELTKRFVRLPRVPAFVAISTAGVPFFGAGISLFYRSIYTPVAFPARNIVAVVEGSDPVLKSEYVVLSAHVDHRGTVARPPSGSDSVYNGADASSGAAALIEIARAFAAPADRPKRSILFVWTVAHEDGLLGAEYFVDNPTVAREKIVAAINLDFIARGNATDIAGGGPAYLATFGERMLSSEISASVDAANTGDAFRFSIVHSPDVRLPDRCSGDEWHFTRRGIPSVRITTGRHRDYRQVTDDVERIDFQKYARVTQFAGAVASQIANSANRPRIEGALPDSTRGCTS